MLQMKEPHSLNDQRFRGTLTCPGPQGRVVGLLSAACEDHHLVQGAWDEPLEGAAAGISLAILLAMQCLVLLVQVDLIPIKLALRGEPAEGQAARGVGLDVQLADRSGTWGK